MNAAELAKFELEITPPDQKELTIDRQNAEAMKRLTGGKRHAKPVPLNDRRRKG